VFQQNRLAVYKERKLNMVIAVVTEVSTKEKNKLVVEALTGLGQEIINVGMKCDEGEPELTYIQTGLISALLLNAGCVDMVVGGCGTGQGFLNSALQYPNVCCGLIQSSLDAWLFAQINGGNCISLALNKGFGWAGDVELKFIFDRLFSVKAGQGYPANRQQSQQGSRATLAELSQITHVHMSQIVRSMPEEVISPAISFPGIMDILRQRAAKGNAILAACEDRLSSLCKK
jgi:ribose 5-phosphate isomerase RpiB